MLKIILSVLVPLLLTTSIYGQNITVSDLIKLADLTHDKAKQYITFQKGFNIIQSEFNSKYPIGQYQKGDEVIIKSQWEDNHRIIPFMHYSIKSKSYLKLFTTQMQSLGFKISGKSNDENKRVELYDNSGYTISIYVFSNKMLPIEIELHRK